jgi:hypothetical protein
MDFGGKVYEAADQRSEDSGYKGRVIGSTEVPVTNFI